MGDLQTDRRKPLANRVNELRIQLAGFNLKKLAARSGGQYKEETAQEAEIYLSMWASKVVLTAPDFNVYCLPDKKELDLASQALILYYLVTADGVLPGEGWISFSDLPDGRFYNQAFQGYTGKELGGFFKDNLAGFETAAKKSGGNAYPLGDAAFAFELFPRVAMLVVAWLGDEEFPSTYQVLFSLSTSHYLPTDACAIAGSMLTRRIMAAADLLSN